jgi:hypothetical protein
MFLLLCVKRNFRPIFLLRPDHLRKHEIWRETNRDGRRGMLKVWLDQRQRAGLDSTSLADLIVSSSP